MKTTQDLKEKGVELNQIYNTDCLEALKQMEDNSVDSVVTDPPYGINFMGKKWDYDVPSVEIWQEILRVLKPGGHALVACGTRTQHRMAVNLEDSGFEIRDLVAWVYGTGFPKNQDISKQIDKTNGGTGRSKKFVEWYRENGLSQKKTNEIIGKSDVGSHYLRLDQPAIPTPEIWAKLRTYIKVEIPEWVDKLVERIEAEREVVGISKKSHPDNHLNASSFAQGRTTRSHPKITAPSTEAANQWEGWGTALKPSMELWTLVRKPLGERNIAENVLKWGTGGINIDECRVEYENKGDISSNPLMRKKTGAKINYGKDTKPSAYKLKKEKGEMNINEQGRFPANFIHDGSEEVTNNFPNGSSRFFYCAKAGKKERNMGLESFEGKENSGSYKFREDGSLDGKPTQAKPNYHPTVKPIVLMKYLCRLITPKGGVVLDPFIGSGTTGIAAKEEGFNFIGVEHSEEYCEIAEARLNKARKEKDISQWFKGE